VYGENDSPAAAPNWGGISNDYGYRRLQSMRMRPVVTDVAWSFCVSVCSINQSINQSIDRSIDQSVNQSAVYLLCSKPKNYET